MAQIEPELYDIISLFELQVKFSYNYRARNCTRRPLTRPMRDLGYPPTDTYYGEVTVGAGDSRENLCVAQMGGGNSTTPENHTIHYVGTWGDERCLPIQRTSFTEQFSISHVSFYDVLDCIQDPKVFFPRRECLSDYEWKNRYTLFGKPADKFV